MDNFESFKVIKRVQDTQDKYKLIDLKESRISNPTLLCLGGNATKYTPFDTLGYYFFIKVAGNDAVTGADYTYASAGGILFTLIVAPVTIITKNLLEKYGPSED